MELDPLSISPGSMTGVASVPEYLQPTALWLSQVAHLPLLIKASILSTDRAIQHVTYLFDIHSGISLQIIACKVWTKFNSESAK